MSLVPSSNPRAKQVVLSPSPSTDLGEMMETWVSFLNILSPELSDEMLADFLNTENGIVVNLHVQAIDQSEAIKTVKRKITDLDAMKIQEQKRAVRSGYDMDIRATRS